VREDDWEQIRALRLEMIEDTPKAYLETLDQALAHGEDEWRFRGRRDAAGNESARFVAEDGVGAWLGTMGCFVDAPGRAHLVGVYVVPDQRGRAHGVTDSLLTWCMDWARDSAGAARMHLFVHEHNTRARAYYRRHGFVETGESEPYALDPTETEIEMDRALAVGQSDER
jgi:ribosomal protein S18 acetylase RimI-like enzyme